MDRESVLCVHGWGVGGGCTFTRYVLDYYISAVPLLYAGLLAHLFTAFFIFFTLTLLSSTSFLFNLLTRSAAVLVPLSTRYRYR